jgi:signal transduction histidine kinase
MILYPPEWLMIGSFIDILFFSIAMSYRNKKQWEKMNAALLNEANEIIEIQKIVLEKQNTLENERNRIARDMHDDLGSGLTKINYLSHLAINNIDVTENLSKINKASSQLVESMSEIIWAIKEENNTIDDLVSFIKLYALEYLDNNKITSTFTIVIERNEIEINGDCRRSIYLIVKEALHNVVKHAQATNVTIAVKIVDQIEITIEDNGVGYNQNMKKYGTGNGIKNMRKRIEIFKGQIEIESKKGTKVIFSLPLNQLNQ